MRTCGRVCFSRTKVTTRKLEVSAGDDLTLQFQDEKVFVRIDDWNDISM